MLRSFHRDDLAANDPYTRLAASEQLHQLLTNPFAFCGAVVSDECGLLIVDGEDENELVICGSIVELEFRGGYISKTKD